MSYPARRRVPLSRGYCPRGRGHLLLNSRPRGDTPAETGGHSPGWSPPGGRLVGRRRSWQRGPVALPRSSPVASLMVLHEGQQGGRRPRGTAGGRNRGPSAGKKTPPFGALPPRTGGLDCPSSPGRQRFRLLVPPTCGASAPLLQEGAQGRQKGCHPDRGNGKDHRRLRFVPPPSRGAAEQARRRAQPSPQSSPDVPVHHSAPHAMPWRPWWVMTRVSMATLPSAALNCGPVHLTG